MTLDRVAAPLTAALMLVALPATGQEQKSASLHIESAPAGATVFIRTGGHNGYAEVGETPITLSDVEPGLLEYTLLKTDRQLRDGALWIEAGGKHAEKVEMNAGRVYFVDQDHPRADDTNAGSEDAPWKTLSKACAVLEAGDTVLVKAGRYCETDSKRPFNPSHSGKPGEPIVLRAYPGHTAILGRGNDPNVALRIYRMDHVVVDGFKVEGKVEVRGEFTDTCDGCIVRNCDVSVGFYPPGDPSLNWGVVLYHARHCRVANNCVHDMTDSGNHAHNTACVMAFASTMWCTIENNEADTGPARCIYNAFGQKGGYIFHNIWRRNIAHNATCAFLGMAATAEDESSGDNVYYENVCIGCKTAFEWNHMCSGYRVFNNTAYDCDLFIGAGKNSTHNHVWNNVISAKLGYSSGVPPLEPAFDFCDYNVLQVPAVARHRWRPYADDVASWQAKSGFGKHSIATEPLFLNAGTREFRISEGSPCIDRGRPVAYTAGSGRDTDVLTVKNEGQFIRVVRAVHGRHGAASPTVERLRLPFAEGDAIQIGKGDAARLAQVVTVVDETHLKLDRKVSWEDGDWVTFPFRGAAPDIGAYEFGDDRRTIGPTWKAYPKRALSGRTVR